MTTPVYHDGLDILARTIYGEARGESWAGKVAVAHVALNRVKAQSWWGRDLEEVCRWPWQFSCWNENDPNRAKLEAVTLKDDAALRECLAAAAAAVWGLEPDPTDGCCHYMTKTRRAQGWPKSWGAMREPHREIGVHLFYLGVK